MSSVAGVTLKNIRKSYGQNEVIHGIDLEIKAGEFCVFVGPSGCGKSTLLRIVAGLEDVTEGTVQIGKRDVTHIDAAYRGIAMVFQTYALYPHMTVLENMSFGLKMNGVSEQEIRVKVDEVAKILQLDPYLERKPKALSGGQRQRVAIGRALVRDPDVFLFDEPLSNLDAELRVEMRVEIAKLHAELGATMIYVTHDQVEAMTLADKIVVLKDGNIEQIGSPMDLYANPVNKFVAGFIGSPAMNFLFLPKGDTQKIGLLTAAGVKVPSFEADAYIGIRPEHLKLDTSGKGWRVDLIEMLGGVSYIHGISPFDEKLVIEYKSLDLPKVGTEFGISFVQAYFFDAQTGARLHAS